MKHCVECEGWTSGTCHEEAVCDHHKVLVRGSHGFMCSYSGVERCVDCAWFETMPETFEEIGYYLSRVNFHAYVSGWDVNLTTHDLQTLFFLEAEDVAVAA